VSARPFLPGDVVRLEPAATRTLGAGLLVSAGGAERPVEALVGTGPDLYAAFAAGLTIAEAAASLAESTGSDIDEIEPHVIAFASQLVEKQLAKAAP
jgi:hypothetical protein